VRYPSEQLTVACLCNAADANAPALAQQIAAIVLPKLVAPPAPAAPTPPPAGPAGKDLSALAGAYLDRSSFKIFTLSVRDGALELHPGLDDAGKGYRLDAQPDGTLAVHGTPARFAVEPARGKAPIALARLDDTYRAARFERFTPAAAVEPATLAEYAGRWTSDETTHDVEVRVVDGKLRFGPWGKKPWKELLVPIEKDSFDTGGGAVVFERDAKKKVHAMLAVLDGFRAVRWTKR
jgi:hypothetical protein